MGTSTRGAPRAGIQSNYHALVTVQKCRREFRHFVAARTHPTMNVAVQIFRRALLLLAASSSIVPAEAQQSASTGNLVDSLTRIPSLTTDAAWAVLGRRNLPIIETLPGRRDSVAVTFVWRGDSATRNVVVVSPITLVDFAGNILRRLGTTDIWYRTIVLPVDARFMYRFAPNDNLIPFDRDTNVFARMQTMQRDPGNPKVFDYGAFGSMSILELPAAPSDSLIRRRPDVPGGTLAKRSVRSEVLGETRTVWIYTPPGYDPRASKRYPVVVLTDGESYQALIPVPTILDNLIAQRSIPPVIALLIDTPNQTRSRDLDCNPEWDRFLTREAIPWLDGHFHTTRDAPHRVVGGYSLGGLAAMCTALRHPDVFGSVIAQSGSFYRAPAGESPEWVARQAATQARLPLRVYLSIGRYETSAIPSADPSMLTASRHLRDVLVARNILVSYMEFSSGHEHVAWRATIGDALVKTLAPAHEH